MSESTGITINFMVVVFLLVEGVDGEGLTLVGVEIRTSPPPPAAKENFGFDDDVEEGGGVLDVT